MTEPKAGRQPIAGQQVMRTWVSWLAFGAIVLISTGYFAGIVSVGLAGKGFYTTITLNHFPAVVGLPVSALAALSLVLFLEHRSGSIELDVVGFKFKGASGPAVLWTMCFLAIVLAIKLLWQLN